MGVRVLLAFDGSDSAALAVDLVAGIRWPAGSRIEVVGVVDGTASFYGVPEPSAVLVGEETRHEIEGAAHDVAADAIEAAAAKVRDAGHDAVATVAAGDPLGIILAEVGRLGIDLVVVGSGVPGVMRAIAGESFTERLLEAAACPVLAARRDRLEPSLVVAEHPEVAASAAASLVGLSLPIAESLAVLGVTGAESSDGLTDVLPWMGEGSTESEAARQEAAARRDRALREVLRVLDAAGLQPEVEEAEDDPVDAALRTIERRGTNTIIAPTGRRIEAEPPIADDAARANRLAAELLRRAPCSILAVPVDRGRELGGSAPL